MRHPAEPPLNAPQAAAPDTVALVRYVVEPNYAGWRLDRYLCEKLRRLSRTRVQEIIANDLVFERALKPSTPVWPGLTFELRRRLRAEPTVPDASALGEVYADEHLLVVDKPSGLPMHPSARYHHNTLTAQLLAKYGPGTDPAHRLDRETSGLVVCGRTLEASQALSHAFAAGLVDKEYLALVEGHPGEDAFVVDAPIAEGTSLIRIAVRIDREQGRAARTRFVVERRFERQARPFTLLRCFPETGRQHQIRVHLAHAGFPLVGDKMYGRDPGFFDRYARRCLEPEAWRSLMLPRHALHATAISLAHPTAAHPVRFDSPLPPDLAGFMAGEPLPPIDDPGQAPAPGLDPGADAS